MFGVSCREHTNCIESENVITKEFTTVFQVERAETETWGHGTLCSARKE